MCGIAGFFSQTIKDQTLVKKMTDEMIFRGPDSEGFFYDEPFWGGMRRLAINDLVTGDQPLFSSDKSIVLFYNGEIYNYLDLKNELIKKGFSFSTASDGEVICHLYKLYGIDFLKYIKGMYSIALWDRNTKTLLVTRDPQGEKPLYYFWNQKDFYFSSNLNSFRNLNLNLTLNKQAIWDFISFLWIPMPSTIYNEVHCLMPGQVILININEFKLIEHIAEKITAYGPKLSDGEVKIKLAATMEKVVVQQLMSDVPVGSFLSGGLDSSIVTTLAKKHSKRLHTFTIGFEDIDDPYHGKADESKYAEEYAAQLNTIHHTINVSGKDFLNELTHFVKCAGQPFAVSSGLGIALISKKAKELGVKVLLTGDGADELFGGYSWYSHFHRLPKTPNTGIANRNFQSMQVYPKYKSETLDTILKYPTNQQAQAWHYYANDFIKSQIFSKSIKEYAKPSYRHFSHLDQNYNPKIFIESDREFYLTNEMLQKADMMTMSYSIEGRIPFVDKEIQNIARSLSFDQLIRDGQLKYILRETFKPILPIEITDRPKHGFNIPIDHWLQNEWNFLIDESFGQESYLQKYEIITPKSIKIVKELLNDTKNFHGHTILCFIILNIWLKEVYHEINC